MADRGVVREWWSDEGWGVIDSPATPGGCWAHFSVVMVDGLRVLAVGQEVELEHEVGWQDGFRFRATAAWPAGSSLRPGRAVEGQEAGYRSELAVDVDDPTPSP